MKIHFFKDGNIALTNHKEVSNEKSNLSNSTFITIDKKEPIETINIEASDLLNDPIDKKKIQKVLKDRKLKLKSKML